MLHRFVHLVPRILSLLFACFLAIFAFDVFTEFHGWTLILALFIHLLPSFGVLMITFIAWKYNVVGAVGFFAAALGYVWSVGLHRPWSWYVIISGTAFLISMLYLIDWWFQKRIQGNMNIQ